MNEQRKKIILSEIKYWKLNNLIPDHYCDFLTALYAEGNEEKEEQGKAASSVLHKANMKVRYSIIIITMTAMLIAIAVTLLKEEAGLIAGGIGVIVLFVYGAKTSMKQTVVLPFTYIMSALLLLYLSLKLWMYFFYEQPMLLIGLLMLNCIMWLFAGRLLKLLYFTLSGAIGLICIILFLVFQF